jgi:Cytochrome c
MKSGRARALRCCIMVAVGLISGIDLARPQDLDAGLETGEAEYLANCANCHGADGKGAGPHAATLKIKPTDLTLLAKKNHGVFPVSQVYQLVDGRGSARKHLNDEMPIWGCRQDNRRPLQKARPLQKTHFLQKTHRRRRRLTRAIHRPAATADFDWFINLTCDPEQTIEQRIMSIVAYLSHIQAK